MASETLLPSNLIAEKAVLSLILSNPETLVEVIDYLLPNDFYENVHQEIWATIVSLYRACHELDIVTIKMELMRQNLDPKPAMESLSEIYQSLPVLGQNLMTFAKEVKNKSMLRQLLGLAGKYMISSKLDNVQAENLLEELEKDVVDLNDKLKDDRPTDPSGILNEINMDIARGEKEGWQGFDTGFRWLDEQTGGLIPTQCWIIGGYTGGGKSFFLLQMILNILSRGAKVMLISTEMDRKINMMRLLGNLAGLGTIKMLKSRLEDDEKYQMIEAQNKLKEYQNSLVIYDNVYTIEDIRLKAKKRKIREGLDVLFVDFIQNLRGAENIYERMSNAAVELQHIAQELKITVVIASQVSQASANWQNKEAIEYKGAGEIAAVADVAIWLKKVEDDLSARQVILRKVRHGIPGHFMVRMSFPSGRVIDLDRANIKEENSEQS